MCISKSEVTFNKVVGKDLLKRLEEIAFKGCKKVNGPLIRHKNEYEILFHTYLAKFAKNWAETVGTPEFTTLFGNLKAGKVDFNVEINDYDAPMQAAFDNIPKDFVSVEELDKQAQEIFSFVGQFDSSAWTDKELVLQVYKQVSGLHETVERETEASEQNPNMDLTKLLDLSMRLLALKKELSKTGKGDMNAAAKIPQLCNPKANRTPVTIFRK